MRQTTDRESEQLWCPHYPNTRPQDCGKCVSAASPSPTPAPAGTGTATMQTTEEERRSWCASKTIVPPWAYQRLAADFATAQQERDEATRNLRRIYDAIAQGLPVEVDFWPDEAIAPLNRLLLCPFRTPEGAHE